MVFTNNIHEILHVLNLEKSNSEIIFDVNKTDLTFIWNTGERMEIVVDKTLFTLKKNQIIFLTEFQKIDSIDFETARMVRFNQPFFCIINHDNEVGSKGLLFFGASNIPVVTIEESLVIEFDISWEIFCSEIQKADILQRDMLQSLLKRMLILSVRILRKSNNFNKLENSQSDIIREFNYLVESHFTKHHDVVFYAIPIE